MKHYGRKGRGKVDLNQKEITDALRQAGASVTVTSMVGNGFPDVAVGWLGRTYLLEIKRPGICLAKRKMTNDEYAWHESWRGHVAVVETVEDAYEILGIAGRKRMTAS